MLVTQARVRVWEKRLLATKKGDHKRVNGPGLPVPSKWLAL